MQKMQKQAKYRIGVKDKLILIIFLTALILVSVGCSLGYFWGYNLLREKIAGERIRAVKLLAGSMADRIEKERREINLCFANQIHKSAAIKSNLIYEKMEDHAVKQYLLDMDKKWTEASDSDPLAREYLMNEASLALKKILREEEDIIEIFITDKFGGLVASSRRTRNFYQGNELWWQKAFAAARDGVFVGDIKFDETSKAWGVPLALPIRDSEDNVIGVGRTIINTENLFEPLKRPESEESGHVALINEKGYVLFHPEKEPLSVKYVNDKDLIDMWGSESGWLIADCPYIHKEKMFTVFATADIPSLSERGKAWRIIIEQDVKEAFAPLSTLGFPLLKIMGVLVIISILLGFIFGRRFAKSINKLTEALQHFREGNLDYKIEIKTRDEIEDLAASFNEMAGDIKQRIGIEQEVYLQAKLASDKEREKSEKLAATYMELKKKTEEIEKLKADLEKGVGERTRDLTRAQEATLNILDDLEETKEAIALDKLKMEYMVKSMTEGLIMVDEYGSIVLINPQAKRMLGFEPAGGVTTGALDDKMKAIGLNEALKESQDKRRLVNKEVTINQKEKLVLSCCITPVESSRGEIIGVVIILIDVTRERKIDEMKTEFVSTVSHELRTPLSIAKEGISLILDGIVGPANERQAKILNTARDNIDRLTRIINTLLDISKLEAGKVEIRRDLVNMGDLMKQVTSSFELKVKDKGLGLKIDFPEKELYIYVDADKISQVFTNLLGNALKFTEKGYIEISAKELEDEVECAVADTGVGISEDDLPHVFNKFQQFGRTAGAGEKGTGLGLSIAKGLVELHKGKIWVESELGKETKISFTLPKYTFRMVLKEDIDARIEEAKRTYSEVSLIVVHILEFDRLRQELPREKIISVLDEIEGVLKNGLRRGGDAVVKNTGEAFLILVECGKEGALRVKERLEQALESYFVSQNLAETIKWCFGYATYPDDGKSSEELLDKIK